MPHYRAYIIGRDGHFEKAIDLDCADDEAAEQSARPLVDGHDAELWQGGRRLAKFDGKEGQFPKVFADPDRLRTGYPPD